jgi:very-short-patch-repair endonuclease
MLCEYQGPIITHQATMSPPTSSHSTIASAPQAEEPLLEAAIAAGPERRAVVERARQHWVSRLIDLSRRNRLLYFQPLRVRTVELDAGQLARALPLLAGQPVPVGRIFRQSELVHRDEDAELFTELHEMDELDVADLGVARRLREIQKRGDEDFEERGLETVHLAYGMAGWRPADVGGPPEAAVLLLPLAVSGSASGLSLQPRGDLDVNLALTHVLEQQFGCEGLGERLEQLLAESDELEPAARAERIFEELQEAARTVPGFVLTPRAVIANFAFQKLAMVEDLERWQEHMAGHDMVSAIAGDEDSRVALSRQRVEVDPRRLDLRAPDQEFLVLDADSSQLRAIAATLQGQSGVIIGPPGTGKSQTIANLVAELVAGGQRVLFLAEKRAALDVVKNRLEERRLGDLVLDIHGALSRKEIMRQFAAALQAVSEVMAPNAEDLHRAFARQRDRLNEYEERLHRPRVPSGWSAYQLLGHLQTVEASGARSGVRWRGTQLEAMTRGVLGRVEGLLERAAAEPPLFLRSSDSPWTDADLADAGAVREAVDLADRLHRVLWPELLRQTADCVAALSVRPPERLDGYRPLQSALEEANHLAELYGPEIFDQDLEKLAADLRPAESPLAAAWAALTSSNYRAARRTLRSLRRAGVRTPTLAAEATAALELRAAWAELAEAGRPITYAHAGSLRESWEAAVEALEQLQRYVATPPSSATLPELASLLSRLAADTQAPPQIPSLRAYEREIAELGARAYVEELKAVRPGVASWVPNLHHAWVASCVDQLLLEEPELAVFNGREHDKVVQEFKALDRRLLDVSIERVRRAYGERAIETANAHRDQWLLLRRQAGLRSRHLPFRELMRRAPDAVTAVKPCWMASPLAVSQILGDNRQHFDVVVFDEASQVLPEDAIAAILRGRSLVVAGDPHQLPPTQFFAADRGEEQGAGEAEDTEGFESILDVLGSFLPRWQLDWHYRSRDERLIAFSNEYVYDRRLVTFPSSSWQTPVVRHLQVEQDRPGGAEEESSSAEVRRVADLVAEHARTRPQASLGVITMGIKHADRIESELARRRDQDPQLEEFMDAGSPERFFVKNLERVQGDERDEIVLSIGYGKDAGGRLPYRFGPLLTEGGHRRLNVAVTRARQRITVVSSFGHLDMDPARSSRWGVELLRLYLQYAASGGRLFSQEGLPAAEQDDLQQQLQEALEAAGLQVTPRFGASRYRIDLAVRHPGGGGRCLLAIETDGAGYHSAATARDRDRLRQEHLEARGWRFLRVWSPDWFSRRDQELERILHAYQEELAAVQEPDAVPPAAAAPEPGHGGAAAPMRAGTRPRVARSQPIDDYREAELRRLLAWIRSDGRLRTDDELLEAMMDELGLDRHGRRIDARLLALIQEPSG